MNKKWALVTGASKGIGREIAKQLAAKGYNLILTSRTEKLLMELAEELTGVECKIIVCDLAQPGNAHNIYNEIKSSDIEPEILINNAGFGLYGYFNSYRTNYFEEMLTLNVTALTVLTHLFAKDMTQRKHGYVLNVASTAAYQATPYFGVYSGSKSYVLNFTKSLKYELKRHGVIITALCPGPTRSNFLDVALPNPGKPLFGIKPSMSSEEVAKLGLKAMFAGRTAIITGFTNKVLRLLIPLLPLWIVDFGITTFFDQFRDFQQPK